MHQYFEVEWLERIEVMASKAFALKDIVNKHACDGETPWDLKLGKNPCFEFSMENIEKSISSFTTISFDRSLSFGFGFRTEHISASSGIYGSSLPVGLISARIYGVKIEAHKAPELFKEVVLLFQMPFLWHIPDPGGPWYCLDEILEAALQRNFSWGSLDSRLHPEQIAVAKSLAAVLPRIGHVYDIPIPNRLRLPQRLGWLNCWSAEVAQHLGFPDMEKDADILHLCQLLPSGHWIVQLTEDPLDLRRADHAEAIVRAYWRFDKIGRRSKPGAKKAKIKTAPVDASSLSVYQIHQSDESGNWWQSDYPPIQATSEEEALRIYFCKLSRSRMPRPHETLNRLRKAYDAVALEVGGMPRGGDVEARLKE